MEGLDSSSGQRDGGVPRGPGGPPHRINAGPFVLENCPFLRPSRSALVYTIVARQVAGLIVSEARLSQRFLRVWQIPLVTRSRRRATMEGTPMNLQWLEMRITEEKDRRQREAEILERLPRMQIGRASCR